MYNIRWTWGFAKEYTQWFLKAEDLDTGLYAVSYFSTDDKDPMRVYETQSFELLPVIVNAEGSDIYSKCRDMKNMHLDLQNGFENVSVANFM